MKYLICLNFKELFQVLYKDISIRKKSGAGPEDGRKKNKIQMQENKIQNHDCNMSL